MSKTARAAVCEAPNSPFVIKEYPLRAIRPGEALLRVTMSTICRSDIHSWEGKRPNPWPGILGHEIVGVIEELGEHVSRDLRGETLAVGDRITWTVYFYDGPSYYRDIHDMPQKSIGVRKYGHDRSDIEPHFLGGFAEYCYLQPGSGILKLPEDLSDEEAAPLNCGVATMIAATEATEIGVGDRVVIQGLGLLGLYGCAMAKARGASLVIGLDTVDDRLRAANSFGADVTINVAGLDEDRLVADIRALCRPDGADAVIEACGVPAVIPGGLRMLRVGGRYTLVGLVSPNADVTFDANILIKSMLSVRGVHNYHPRHLVQALDFVMAQRNRFPFKDIVDSRFGLGEVNEAFRKAAADSVLRAAIVP